MFYVGYNITYLLVQTKKKRFVSRKETSGASKRNKHRRVSVLNLDIRKGTLLATYKSYEHTLVHTTLQV